jgi:hypothetical protein
MKLKITLTSKPGVIPIGAEITLRKQPDNAFDDEAIEVIQGRDATGFVVGYVAAYYKIRKPGTVSAGRLVDKIPDTTTAVVVSDQVAEVEVE